MKRNMREDLSQKGWTASLGIYGKLKNEFGKPADCVACGQCESVCPQHLPIIENLKLVAEHYANV